MKMWWLPPSVANTLITCGTVLTLGSIWLLPHETTGLPNPPAEMVRLIMAILGVGLGAGMIVNGIARSTRPPDSPK